MALRLQPNNPDRTTYSDVGNHIVRVARAAFCNTLLQIDQPVINTKEHLLVLELLERTFDGSIVLGS